MHCKIDLMVKDFLLAKDLLTFVAYGLKCATTIIITAERRVQKEGFLFFRLSQTLASTWCFSESSEMTGLLFSLCEQYKQHFVVKQNKKTDATESLSDI